MTLGRGPVAHGAALARGMVSDAGTLLGTVPRSLLRFQAKRGERWGLELVTMARCGTFMNHDVGSQRVAALVQQQLARGFPLLQRWTLLLVLPSLFKLNVAKYGVAYIDAWQDTAIS